MLFSSLMLYLIQQALVCHPDKNPGNEAAAEQFKSINRAHGILMDEKKRQIYDSYGSVGLQIADQIGEENIQAYMAIQKPWVKVTRI